MIVAEGMAGVGLLLAGRPVSSGHRQNQGVLNVKAAVADGTWLLVTSATLTENAFLLNMELGV